MKKHFVEQTHWDAIWQGVGFEAAPQGDVIREWLTRQLGTHSGACLELGCFPGRYLAVLAELGYEVHGIDLTPRVDSDLKTWMQRQGYKVGEFVRADVLTYPYQRKYDVVCSFGFIEHFGDWPGVLALQANLVANDGYLVVSAPNFKGWVQYGLHRCLDQANLAEHNIHAMVPLQWAKLVASMGFDIHWSGYVGRFDFWVGMQPMGRLKKAIVRTIQKTIPGWRMLPPGGASYAPYCGLIARKRAS